MKRRDRNTAERLVHLNNAGAALPPRQVTEAAVEHLRLEARMGGYGVDAPARIGEGLKPLTIR